MKSYTTYISEYGLIINKLIEIKKDPKISAVITVSFRRHLKSVLQIALTFSCVSVNCCSSHHYLSSDALSRNAKKMTELAAKLLMHFSLCQCNAFPAMNFCCRNCFDIQMLAIQTIATYGKPIQP